MKSENHASEFVAEPDGTIAGMSREQVGSTTGRSAPEHADDVAAHQDADAGDLIHAIDRARVATDADGMWLDDDMVLPGFGTPYDDCGDDFPRFCSDCGSVSMWSRTCYRSTCKRCAKSWARRTSSRVCAKLEAMRRYRSVILEDHQRFHHVVVSPPAEWHPEAENSWQRAKDVVKEILEESGLWGYVVYHPFKGKDGDDRGAWKNRVLTGDLDWEEVKDELVFAPHFHIVAVGHEVPGGSTTRAVESSTGWVIHRITKEGTNVSLYDEYDLARAVTYCLSHAGIDPADGDDDTNDVATRWTGGKLNDRSRTVNDVTASDALEDEMDAVVRSVAPKTLNLAWNGLACGEEYGAVDLKSLSRDDDQRVDVASAEASRMRGSIYAGGAGSGSGSCSGDCDHDHGAGDGDLEGTAGDLPSTSGTGLEGEGSPGPADTDDYLDDLEKAAAMDVETEHCRGRMLGLGKAARYLDDDEWRDDALHADELEREYREWSERLEWLGSG